MMLFRAIAPFADIIKPVFVEFAVILPMISHSTVAIDIDATIVPSTEAPVVSVPSCLAELTDRSVTLMGVASFKVAPAMPVS